MEHDPTNKKDGEVFCPISNGIGARAEKLKKLDLVVFTSNVNPLHGQIEKGSVRLGRTPDRRENW